MKYCICSIDNKNILTYYLRYQVAKLFHHPSYCMTTEADGS